MEPTPPPLNILPRLTLSPCVQVHPQSDLLTTLSTTPYLPPLPVVTLSRHPFALRALREILDLAMVDQLLLNTLRTSKVLFWEDHKGQPNEEIQELWNHQMAYLTTELGANVTGIGPSSIPQKRVIPSTNAFVVPRPSKRRELNVEAPSILQRQQSAPASTEMRRRRSSKTNSGSGPSLSRSKPSSSRPINIPAPKHRQPRAVYEAPYSAYTSHSLPAHPHVQQSYRPSSGDFRDLSPAGFLSQSPDDYQMPGLSVTPSPTVARGEFRPQDLSRLSVSTAPGYAWECPLLSKPVSDSGMTNASTATSEPMSRITTNEMLIEPLRMCRVGSQLSGCDTSEALASVNDFGQFDLDPFFPASFDSGLLGNLSDISFDSFSPSHSLPHSFIPSSVDMLHSPSQESIDSSSSSDSSQSRHVRRVQEQNVQSQRKLAPKTQSQKSHTAMPPTTIVEVVAEDGTRQKKAQIARSNRQPKETTKVFCPICRDHKEGFHGDHELRRHIDRTHKGCRKVFVCKDISPDKTFLANCKHCRNQKAYGANYGAAAHLRRVHFNPCETPKGGRGKVSQNRGGIGGGDDPPMEVLRNWMYEAWETNRNGLTLDDSSLMNTVYAASNLSSCGDSGPVQSNDTVQISDHDLDFVQQTTQMNMSFLRYPFNDTLNMSL